MAKKSTGGVQVVHSRGMHVQVLRPRATKPGRRAAASAARSTAADPMTELLAALRDQELEETRQLRMVPTAATRARAARSRSAAPAAAVVEVRVEPHESAVILVEHDGVWSWHFPDPAAPPRATRREVRAATSAAAIAPSVVRIEMRLPMSAPAQRQRASVGKVLKSATGFVMKFVVRAGTALALKLLERNVKPGLIVMDGNDVGGWRSIDTIDQLRLPQSETARVLLWIHGTFSSTVGSFGPLTATPDGRALLDGARRNYHAVIGFDHRTLSETPLENAVDLLERMGRFKRPMQIDVVTFSRGGLVFRSLVEQLLPVQSQRPAFGPVVFVAVPNSGTSFAEPENWRALVDTYTNLASGALRLLGAAPQATGVSLVFRGLIAGLGALVKALADVVISEKAVPGLAAQQPSGDFVRVLNQSDPSQPQPSNTRYLAITSNFDADGAIARGTSTGLPQAFLLRLADGLVDKLMGEPNDLVVNTPSMKRIDPAAGKFIDASLDFDHSQVIYHTVYFAQPEVAQCLTGWLLDESARRGLIERRGLLTVSPSPRAPFTRVRYHAAEQTRSASQQTAGIEPGRPKRRGRPTVAVTAIDPRTSSHLRSVARKRALELLGRPNPAPSAAESALADTARALATPRARSHAPTLADEEIQRSSLPNHEDIRVVSFTQTHAAIPIFGTRAVLELDPNEQLVAARAKLARVDGVSPIPQLSVQQARAALAKQVPAAKSQDPRTSAQLTFFHDREHGRWRLTYLFPSIEGLPRKRAKHSRRSKQKNCALASSPRSRSPYMDYLVDANDGSIAYCYSTSAAAAKRLKALPVACTGVDTEGKQRRFDGARRGQTVQMHDPQRGIRTFDLDGGDIDEAPLPRQPIGNDSHKFGRLTPAGISAHYYTSRVFDFFNQVLIRKGVDDAGMELVNVVNVTSKEDEKPPTWGNAAWWNKRMWYGRTRNGKGFESFAKHLDIIAHELTHGVTDATSKLVYRDESGALNESFSDIFGVIIKNWLKHGADSDPAQWDWEFGPGLGATRRKPLRNLKNPALTGDPDHASKYQKLPLDDDEGGVHTNSNIHNKAAYNLLTARVPGKGPLKNRALAFDPLDVARAYYFTLQRLDRLARFEDVLTTLLDVVKTMYPDRAEQKQKLAAVTAAYGAIGIPRPSAAMR
ncbi:MAG TPA: M4 family metallopeptidase [Polyangiales bacterium]|nr:M4 family metallopeptidase [Polyangiales bacterium]